MVKIDIKQDELQALDILLDKEVKLKPIVAYKLINFRIKVQNTIMAENQKQQGEVNANGKANNRKTNKRNKE
jgi:hypothetical protein